MQQLQFDICQVNLGRLECGPWRLCDIITGDETWVYHRVIDSKQSNITRYAESANLTGGQMRSA